MRQCRLHTTHTRLITILAQPGIKPDETVTAPPKTGELAAEQGDIPTVAAVRDEQDDGAAAEHQRRPLRVKCLQAGADTGSATPIAGRSYGCLQARLPASKPCPAARKGWLYRYGRHTRELRGKDKRLDCATAAAVWPGECTGELQQDARIAFHRTADVTEQDNGPLLDPAVAARKCNGITAGSDAGTEGRAEIRLAAAAVWPQPAAAPRGQSMGNGEHGVLDRVSFTGSQQAKVTLAQLGSGAVGQRTIGRRFGRLGGVGRRGAVLRPNWFGTQIFEQAALRTRVEHSLRPEAVKRPLETGQFLLPPYKDRACGVTHAGAIGYIDPCQALYKVERLRRRDGESFPPQKPRKPHRLVGNGRNCGQFSHAPIITPASQVPSGCAGDGDVQTQVCA